jgi:hypothetical protein
LNLISEPIPQLLHEPDRLVSHRVSFWPRVALAIPLLVTIGWLWPYDLSTLPTHLGSTSWILGWFTALILLGAAVGYALRTRWSVIVAPLGLYLGGVIHWVQFELGTQLPDWTMFAMVSAMVLGFLLITAGAAAGIASRVVLAEEDNARPAQGIRLSAALAALLGLIAITAVNVLPMPFIGAMFGLAALLAGAGLLEEEHVNMRERLLAIAGMLVGMVATATQIYALWTIVRDIQF